MLEEHRMHKELETAKALAIRAGAILLEHYERPRVSWKGPGNPVTDADCAANSFIVRELRQLFPEDGILSEEEKDDASRLTKSRVWIVDPLDGTAEFIDHRDEFSVMIGLAIDGAACLGVVYQPPLEKLYYAALGAGAFVVDSGATNRLQVSAESNPDAMVI